MDKYIITDFDGVMTSCLPGGGSYLTNPPDKYSYSKDCLDNLNSLMMKTGAKVVVSSNWRRFGPTGGWINIQGKFDKKTYFNPLPKLLHDLGSKVASVLPTDRHLTKSEALVLWLREFKNVPDFVIFDDDLNEDFQNTFDYGIYRKFILTDPKFGLTKADISIAIDKFKEQEQEHA